MSNTCLFIPVSLNLLFKPYKLHEIEILPLINIILKKNTKKVLMLVICIVLDLFTVEENEPIKSCTLVCAFQISAYSL